MAGVASDSLCGKIVRENGLGGDKPVDKINVMVEQLISYDAFFLYCHNGRDEFEALHT